MIPVHRGHGYRPYVTRLTALGKVMTWTPEVMGRWSSLVGDLVARNASTTCPKWDSIIARIFSYGQLPRMPQSRTQTHRRRGQQQPLGRTLVCLPCSQEGSDIQYRF